MRNCPYQFLLGSDILRKLENTYFDLEKEELVQGKLLYKKPKMVKTNRLILDKATPSNFVVGNHVVIFTPQPKKGGLQNYKDYFQALT